MAPETTTATQKITPVILSGGAGTRLWPLSRGLFPKQLHCLASDYSLLQDTVRRTGSPARFNRPLIVCNSEHRFLIAEQLRNIETPAQEIVLEPVGRNTAPAAGIAALILAEQDPDALMLVLPADHVIRDDASFLAAISAAVLAANEGHLVTFGNQPTAPSTGFGYIKRGTPQDGRPGCFNVDSFVEKPDLATAEEFLADGNYFWNAGIFLFRASQYLAELSQHQPELLEGCKEAVATSATDQDFRRLDKDHFATLTNISIDYAVMEVTQKAAVVPVDMGWSDVGSWDGLWDIAAKDSDGNVLQGDVVAHEVRNSYLFSDGPLVAGHGLDNMVVVALKDSVLVMDRESSQGIKAVVDRLSAAGRSEIETPPVVRRPWGSYCTIDVGPGFQVKRITVNPGGHLSLQKHHHRAEHWVVVEGEARGDRRRPGRDPFEKPSCGHTARRRPPARKSG